MADGSITVTHDEDAGHYLVGVEIDGTTHTLATIADSDVQGAKDAAAAHAAANPAPASESK